MRLTHKERVTAFGVALQEVAFTLVVQNFHLVLGANLAAFREATTRRERAGEGAVFRMEGGHVLVQSEFQALSVDVFEKVKELRAVKVPRGVERREPLRKKPVVAYTVGGVQAVVAGERDT